MILDKSLNLDRSMTILTQYEKNSASKLKKQELVLENQKMNASENLAERIGYYFNPKGKIANTAYRKTRRKPFGLASEQ